MTLKIDEVDGGYLLVNDYGHANMPSGKDYFAELSRGDKITFIFADKSKGCEELEITSIDFRGWVTCQ